MSSEPAIVAEGLGKRYRLTGAASFRYRTLRDELATALRRRRDPADVSVFWALRDVSFEIGVGETVGIIGRNGAGKSTLLKLLAKITLPTTGQAQTRGRVGSLLEVGTGFHEELTGRENILLAGAIMGMRRAEVLRRFDEIVEFSGVSAFLDMPIKRYSSGMYMRLAFSVAAHLEPEILLVDEVLAVGDADFQRKCLGRMSEFAATGRTVLFVSHSMPTIFRLCPRVILLDHGGVVADGPSSEAVAKYLSSGSGSAALRTWETAEAPGDDTIRLRAVRVLNERGEVVDEIDVRERFAIQVEYDLLKTRPGFRPFANVHFFNDQGVCLFITGDHVNPKSYEATRLPGRVRSTCWIPGDLLNDGRIALRVAVSSLDPTVVHALEDDAVSFMVVDKKGYGGARGPFARDIPGAVRPLFDWVVESEPSTYSRGEVAS